MVGLDAAGKTTILYKLKVRMVMFGGLVRLLRVGGFGDRDAQLAASIDGCLGAAAAAPVLGVCGTTAARVRASPQSGAGVAQTTGWSTVALSASLGRHCLFYFHAPCNIN